MGVLLRELAEQRLRPAPLVPTTAPRSLSPVGDFVDTFDTSAGYGIVMGAIRRGRLYALVSLSGGAYPSARVARRTLREAGFRARSTRIRGRRGYLFTITRRARALLWSEGGVVYVLTARTLRTVSLRELRATAESLDRLEGYFVGTRPDEDTRNMANSAVAITTRTVTVEVEFRAPCIYLPTGEPGGSGDGVVTVTLGARQGDSFSFDIAPNVDRERSSGPWQGTVSGTVNANGGTVNLRATGNGGDSEQACDTGPVSIPLRPYP
jgi:hypothetical protein